MKYTLLLLNTFFLSFTRAQLQFPPDFQFGVASSAYQIEGAWNTSGKGLSTWDQITHITPDFVKDKSNGDIASDSYHKYVTDVKLLRELGVNFYRFSISWARIFPDGTVNNLNQEGVFYYNNLINALIQNGIEPMITLVHFDPPHIFSPMGTMSNIKFVEYFTNYAEKAFELFGDRVKTWITFNEPKVMCVDYNEYNSIGAKAYPLGLIEYECIHTILNAHAQAYKIYKSKFKSKQKGRVGIALNLEWSETLSQAAIDLEAAERRRQFEFGIFAGPLIHGDYPKVVKERVAMRSEAENFPKSRLPELTLGEKLAIHHSTDFIGLTHFSTFYAKEATEAVFGKPSFQKDLGTERFQDPSWPGSANKLIKTVPWGLYNALKWIKETYSNPVILITGCGYPGENESTEDPKRILYYQSYLNATLQAIHEDKVKVEAFTAYSFLDSFEWDKGYTMNFGLVKVDYKSSSLTRTLKDSAKFYQGLIKSHKV